MASSLTTFPHATLSTLSNWKDKMANLHDTNNIVDAEYMNRWLGDTNKITAITPKTLFDVQSLIEYYRDIIVPNQNVSVTFPMSGTNVSPHASVDQGKVVIPYHLLADGRVDHTIGAMIHELHHIKMSPTESYVRAVGYTLARSIMDNLQIGSISMSSRIFSDSHVSFGVLHDPNSPPSKEIQFLRSILGDMMFLVNAVEDVRIDANTPENLRKYINKIDEYAGESLRELYDSGKLEDDSVDLTSIAFLLLGHHKDMFHSPRISRQFGDTSAIVNAGKLDLAVSVLKAFSDEIAQHILNEYNKRFDRPEDTIEGEFDVDSYFCNKVGAESSNKFTKDVMESVKDSSSGNLCKVEKQLSECGKDAASKTKNIPQQKLDDSDDSDETQGKTAAQKHREGMDKVRNQSVISNSLNAQIKSFKDVIVSTTTEHFDESDVTYDIVIFDAV